MSVTARALAVAPGAARALRPGARGAVEVARPDGGYLRLGEADFVHLCGPRATAGPLSLRVAGLAAGALRPGAPVRCEADALEVDGLRVELAGAQPMPRAPGLPPLAAGALLVDAARRRLGRPANAPPSIDASLAAASDAVPAAPPVLHAGLERLSEGDLAAAVRLLAGLGEGLTPAGDDVLAGFAGWRVATGRPVQLSALAGGLASPIGLAYLRCAERGELAAPADALLRAILAGHVRASARRARVLYRWGATSGFALLWGMAAGAAAPADLPALPQPTPTGGAS